MRLAPKSTALQDSDPASDREDPTPSPPRSSVRAIVLSFGLGVLGTVVALQLLPSGRQAATTEAPATPVAAVDLASLPSVSITATEAEAATVARRLEASGSVAARELLPIATQAAGLQIREILVDEGDLVQRGQLLARLDDTRLQAERARAAAEVTEAEARLAELRAGARTEEIARAEESVKSSEAAVRRAESNVALVESRVESNQFLASEGAIANDRLNELLDALRSEESELLQAKAQLREDQQSLQELRAGTRPENIRQAEAQLASAQAQARVVEAQLQDTRIVAPAAGRILERTARVGGVVANADTLFTLSEGDRLELRLRVPETQLEQIRPGQAVTATAGGTLDGPIQGRIREIQPAVEEESRLAIVRVDLPASERLRPGMFLQAQTTISTLTGVVLPSKAVLPQTDGRGLVYRLLPDGTVSPQDVELGELLSGGRIEILAGLEPGDRVAVEGAAYLKPGDRVEVITQ